jgi:hypothetical protein
MHSKEPAMSGDLGEASARLGLPYLAAGQMQKHVTLNAALTRLDMLVQAQAISRTTANQPSSPTEGAVYIVPEDATGDYWSLFAAGDLARHESGGWTAMAAPDGLLIHVADEDLLLIRSAGTWRAQSGQVSELQAIARLGVNTEADAVNPVAIRAPKILMTAIDAADGGSGDLRITLNKEGPSDIVSILYQDGYAGRAEIGLIGSNDFAFKVSSDGATWNQALTLAAASGMATLAGIGPLIRAETIAAISQFTVKPSRRQVFLLDDLISDLIDAGVWAKLDILYVLAAHNAQAARINLKAPGAATLTPSGAPTFTSFRGYQGDGIAGHLNSGVTFSSLSRFSASDGALFVWSLTALFQNGRPDMGAVGGTNSSIYSGSAAGNLGVALNGENLNAAVPTSAGLSAGNRTASTVTTYKDGVAIATNTQAAGAMATGSLTLMRAGSTYSARQLAAAGVGSALSADDHRVLYNSLRSYLTAVGAV